MGAYTGITAYGQTMQVEVDGLDVYVNTQGFLSAGQGVTFTLDSDTEYVIGTSGYQNHNIYLNFGQKPFVHESPRGFSAYTSNTAEPVSIVKPDDHFSVISATADTAYSLATGKFADGMWMIKDRSYTNDWKVIDSIRGYDKEINIVSFNNEHSYSQPTGNSICYGWKTDEDFVPQKARMLEAYGKRNRKAGFSMINYVPGAFVAGESGVGHGLDQPPDLVVLTNRNIPSRCNQSWVVWHRNFYDFSSVNPERVT